MTAHPDWRKVERDEAKAQEPVAQALEKAWTGTIVGSFPFVSAIDWWVALKGRHLTTVGVAELKTRTHAMDRYETVYLSVYKWTALTLTAIGLGVVPLYVVSFTDGVRWVDLRTIYTPARPQLLGRFDRGREHDVEPIVEIPTVATIELPAEPKW